MKQRSLDELMNKVDSKYTLVVVAAKRARTIMDDERVVELQHGVKPVSLALEEIAEGKIGFERTCEGIK